jgi:ABC-type transporter Mla subunit MlaD
MTDLLDEFVDNLNEAVAALEARVHQLEQDVRDLQRGGPVADPRRALLERPQGSAS